MSFRQTESCASRLAAKRSRALSRAKPSGPFNPFPVRKVDPTCAGAGVMNIASQSAPKIEWISEFFMKIKIGPSNFFQKMFCEPGCLQDKMALFPVKVPLHDFHRQVLAGPVKKRLFFFIDLPVNQQVRNHG